MEGQFSVVVSSTETSLTPLSALKCACEKISTKTKMNMKKEVRERMKERKTIFIMLGASPASDYSMLSHMKKVLKFFK